MCVCVCDEECYVSVNIISSIVQQFLDFVRLILHPSQQVCNPDAVQSTLVLSFIKHMFCNTIILSDIEDINMHNIPHCVCIA